MADSANTPGVITSSTETFSGNQSSGITPDSSNPAIQTIIINNLSGPIAPSAGTNGVTLNISSGGNASIFSGTSGSTVTINATGANATGITIQSVGTPPSPPTNSFLGIQIPASSTAQGGIVTVDSASNISTNGLQGYGISAKSATTGFSGSVISSLTNFSDTGQFAFTVTGVENTDLSSGTVGDPVTAALIDITSGSSIGAGGTVTLSANGSYVFNPGTAATNLATSGTMYVSVNDTITGTNSTLHTTGTSQGTVLLQVVRTGTGTTSSNFTVTTIGSDFTTQTIPGYTPLGSAAGVLPTATDLSTYVASLETLVDSGGAGNSVTVTNSGSVQTSGSGAHAIFITSQGGNGGGGRDASITHSSTQGGNGSEGGTVTGTANGYISTTGTNAAGVLAWSLGGNGGSGGDSGYTRNAKSGGDGATGGTVNVFGNGTIVTSGSGSSGIIALSQGGNGGQGGAGSTFNDGDDGGKGGMGGTVNVTGTWNISTTGDQAHGIWARSVGGIAGGGGSGGWAGTGGGSGGQATDGGSVTVVSSGSISTTGSAAYGIYGESIGGFGGNGGNADSVFYSSGGSGASAGSGGDVSITNNGTIKTTGIFGNGIFAQSVGGGGGSGGGNSIGSLAGLGGSGQSGGDGGNASITNSGTISVSGSGARGIYAQSVGGGGGDGGSLSGLVPIGGSGAKTSGGGTASVYNTGKVTATSNAIFVQSIGGGGGNGGSATGWFSVGGPGGAGGDGGAVAATSNGDLSTSEANASAIFAQSLGGGGGNGGNSVAVGAFGSLAIGGKGGVGGKGSTVTVGIDANSTIDPVTGKIITTGANSNGIQAQSVGGGGGNGGYAFAGSIGSGASLSVAIGGGGGAGSESSEVDVFFGDASSSIKTSGANSNGIYAQSVGGGGGSGGFAIAAAGGDGFSAAIALGGTGGSGGDGGVVNVGSSSNETSGTIATTGDHSYGILAQSVGGGGGNGGYSIAGTVSIGGVGGSLSFGGSGGIAGVGDTVNVYSASDVSTTGNNSTAIFAQSVGGGGGSGGFSIAAGLSTGAALDLSFGGKGGGGGNGDTVTLHSDGNLITTVGNNSDGILAQSVGGGGGNGGFSVAGSLTGGPAVNLAIGGGGGTASSGSSVTVENSSTIATGGNGSVGIFAQSVGGGGGSGGFSIAAGISINPVSAGAGSNVSVGLGGNGGAGGSAGNVVVTTTGSMILTGTGYASGNYGNNSDGILAQSVGGGGGAGGFSIAGGIASGASVNFSMAGSGTTGGNAGTVNLTSSSVVATNGTNSSAIFAQSVGGGGGQGGFSVAGGISDESASINASIGGGGGSGGTASNVTVVSTGTLVMAGSGTIFNANDNHSYGIAAQSIGGSGGDGGFSVAGGISIAGPTLNFSLGGAGGTGQDAGAVQLLSTSEVVTHGNDSTAIFAQSIGGGGGSGGFSVAGGISGDSVALDASIGGSGAGGGSAGNVAVGATITGTDNSTGLPTYSGSAISGGITTYGDNSFGIQAQSIGGGGGNGGFSIAGGISDSASVNFSMGGGGGNAGTAGSVVLDSASSIFTSGSNSTAIFAQSLGGGGGSGGFSVEGSVSANSGAVGASIGGNGSSGGNAGTVTLISTGNLLMTTGDHSNGILAQSVGGGGGDGGFSVAGSITDGNSGAAVSFSMGGKGGGGGLGNVVYVDSSSSIQTSGANSNGIFAQSVGGGGGDGGFSVTGNISTGSTASVGASIGGKGGTGNTANNVTVISSGSLIMTTGSDHSSGIVAQSVGGGGGDGGFSVAGSISTGTNVNFSLGGSGGTGNDAGVVIVSSSSAIGTTGNNSDGIFAQSLGGGGGNGGFSVAGSIVTGSDTPSVNVSIGGKGGAAGSGTTVNVTSTGTLVSTQGDHSVGILAQSVGGGGGDGGFSVAGGISTGTNVNFSLGGKGGSAGSGGNVTVSSSSSITTIEDNSDGILAQSLGGGGGDGGFSIAGGITTGSQTPTVNASIGGGGGSGQDGGTVTVTSTGILISTSGDHSDGILAQSLGGGGGAGGFSVTGGFSKVNAVDFSLGGAGGPGEDAMAVKLDSSSNIITTGNYSLGIFAQSVGGGGGDGGFSVAASGVASGTAIDSSSKSITASIGGGGGDGGIGGNVTVGNLAAITGTISTSGTQSTGILAQSIGGGGGNGGFSIAGSIDTKGGSKSVAFSLGGGGGTGGTSGTVSVNSAATIMTNDENSIGILAQSVGGGGGNGGFSVAGAVSVGGTDDQTSMSLSAAIGGHGGGGNTGNVVTVTNSGAITTQADDSTAILAQSVGGGGGNGGWSLGVSGITNADSAGKNIGLNLSVGGGGGTGNDANDVTVTNTGNIVTNGGDSDGIAAQSIGGGGGNGGTAKTFTLLVASPGQTVANLPLGIGSALAKEYGLSSGSQKNNYEATISVGGTGGGSGSGGTVMVSSTSNISTNGIGSNGISAQSIGGGGGNGGDGLIGTGTPADDLTLANQSGLGKTLTIAVGGNAGSDGNGGKVIVNESGTISTQGLYSNGIQAQSVGGGGGVAYLTITGTETAGNVGPTGGSSTIGMTGKVGIGGAGGAAGDGDDVNVTVASGSISTEANGSNGIFAQSVGGGGGVAGDVDRGLKSEGVNFGIGLAFGRSGGGGGHGGNVTVSSTANITTVGDNSYGIFAQSVGGGGGETGSLGNGPEIPISLFIGSVGGSGTSGVVTITHTGNIMTSGSNADGIFAQSSSGTTGNISSGTSGNVSITLAGNITTTGTQSDGIYVQSVSLSGHNGNDLVTIMSGTVQGSSGTDSAGIRLIDGNNNQLTNHGTIETADLISGSAIIAQVISGTAVSRSTKNQAVDNYGIVIGSVDLGTGSNSFTHESGALLESGAVINLGTGNYFYNSGTISAGGIGNILTTNLTGNFTQKANATWFFDINSDFTSDLFAISGTGNLGNYSNTVNLNELAVPATTGTYTLITAPVGLTGSFQFGTMSGTTMPIGLTYTLTNSDTQEVLNLITSSGTFFWRGAVDGVWNDDFVNGQSNFTSDVAGNNYIFGTPGVADDVVFSSTTGTNQDTMLGADFLVNSLIVSDTTPVTIGGTNRLTIAAASGVGITVNNGAAPFTISANLALGGDQSWTNNSSNLMDISGSSITSPGNYNLTVEGSGTTQISALIATGSGSLTKDGSGLLIVFNTTNTYSGGTNLKDGTLLVANSNALGVGEVNLTGGVLMTTNDPLTSATTALPLNVGGNYSQIAPAVLQLRILRPTGTIGAGINDEVFVAGQATLGGTFRPDYSVTGYNPIPPAGNYTDAFEVLHANGGVSGTFSSFVDVHFNANKLLRWEPVYNPDDVMLEWNQHPFSSLTDLTSNQTSVANVIDLELGLPVPPVPKPYNESTGPALAAHPGLGALVYFLNNDSLANLPHDYDLIAPDELTSIFEISRSFADVQDANIENRLASDRAENMPPPSTGVTVGLLAGDGKSTVGLRDDDKSAAAPEPMNNGARTEFFMEGNGDFVHVNGDSNAPGYSFNTGGVTVGGDYRLNNHFVIGMMAGYANTGATLTQNGAVDVNSGKAGIFSTIYGNGFYLNSMATGGYNSYDTHRNALGGIAQGKTDGVDFDSLISGGYDLHSGNFTLGPVLAAQYTNVGIQGYTEGGSSLAPLHIEGQNQQSLRSKAGFKISYIWNAHGVIITPMLSASWEHEYLGSSFALDSQFASGAGNVFTVNGPVIGRDGVLVNTGVNFQWTPRFGTYLYYNGELGRKNYQMNSVSGGVRLNF